MNEADFPSINLDELRLVPDWLKEDAPAPSKQYASYDRPMEADDQTRRRPRPGGGGQDRRDPRDSRPGRDRRPGPGGRSNGPMRSAPPGRQDAPRHAREDYPVTVAAPIRVEFLPDEKCMVSIIKQIRSTHLAYPLFSLARMFLQEPERHYLQLSLVPGALPAGTALHQLGDEGVVTLDRALLEGTAFDTLKERYYKEETVQKDPPKGNFTNVARERQSGTLLGPTNYHGYQPALRALFESRFSRRMSFEEYRRNIEVSSDPALIERWKEDARTATTISTVDGDPATVFASGAEARAHFRQHHLENSVQRGMSFRLHGSVARRLPEPAVMQAIREAHERELRYPAQFVQLLRQGLQNAGLHIFKHRKRIVYVAATRPTPFVPSSGAVTENVSLILETIAEFPLCTRKMLAERVLSKKLGETARRATRKAAPGQTKDNDVAPTEETPLSAPDSSAEVESDPAREAPAAEPAPGTVAEFATPAAQSFSEAAGSGTSPGAAATGQPTEEVSKAKSALAADVRFLVQAGHIIEFHNGTFDLPLPPKPKEEPSRKNVAGSARVQDEGTQAIGADPAAVAETGSGLVESDESSAPEADTETQMHREEPAAADATEPPAPSLATQEVGLLSTEGSPEREAVHGDASAPADNATPMHPSEERP